MKVNYDKQADAMYITFNANKVNDTAEDNSGIVVDCDIAGGIVCIEILAASSKISKPDKMAFEVAW